ncbi:TlpA family protein disulfide reductase [Foetidibacter luteolus]|uniref:TlpA family protein disulfide reductase n=1 Tax=Foetidibacter luteolus TaxID=2608880 RepID=UPI00129A1F4E|nr:TlpA disulfide reductase family protein [Foetidibacter luteolus]
MKKAVSVIALMLLVFGLKAQPKVGTVAPDIELPNAKGVATKLSSLKGKVVLIDFWASWCGPCRRSVPGLKTIYKKYKDKGFEIYGVSLDSDSNDWKRAIFDDGVKWLQVLDLKGDTAGKWDVNYIPNTFLIDKEGKLVAINANHDALDQLLQKLLG